MMETKSQKKEVTYPRPRSMGPKPPNSQVAGVFASLSVSLGSLSFSLNPHGFGLVLEKKQSGMSVYPQSGVKGMLVLFRCLSPSS